MKGCDKMEKYLIMTDLDNTLLNKKHELSLLSKLYIRKLVRKGHYFILATGRPIQGCIHFYNKLKLNSYLVCDNGGSIIFPLDESKNIIKSIPLNLFIEFLNEIKDYIYAGMSATKEKVYYQNGDLIPIWMKHDTKEREIINGNLNEIIEISPINPNLFIKTEYLNEVKSILSKEKYSSIFTYRHWSTNKPYTSFEIFRNDATKGNALLDLKNILKIKKECDLAFGDQLNDFEMIQSAFNGVAMINGRDELKSIAKYITFKPNTKNGEIHFIKKFLKNK
jgi:Cof subfamily protein (haloacid dehalogenase superfamily)